MSEIETLLEVKDLYVNYKSYWYIYKVLNGVSLKISKGEKIGILGESGAGKTTLLKSILGILPPQGRIVKGDILYKGRSLIHDKKYLNEVRRSSIGMIFQDPLASLNPVFTVKEHLLDVLKVVYKDHNYKESDLISIATELLKEVMLPDVERVLNSYPFQLSGGMRQRVVIAMALASAKELLLADEPTTNLDVTIQDQILRLIERLVNEKNLSLILVSHALGLLFRMVNTLYVMYGGEIVEYGDARKILKEPLHPYTKMLLISAPRLTSSKIGEGIKGNPPDYRNPPSGCRFHPRCPFAMDICKKEKPKLIRIGSDHYVACHLYSTSDLEKTGSGI